ncbi:small ribosomal subunit protein uS14-like [Macaca nemestrina]|uniref:40S ribosomal protein S29-like n=1 Tax=Macaca thibetana thibetana TaxID=257877 RepID=UPI0021BC5F11|nr:40S ribosomal protein S29-like [Macaca thibetana thibetana]
MGHQQPYWSHLQKLGQGSRSSHICPNQHSLIRKPSLNMCRQCFRQYMKDIGFIELDQVIFLEWSIQGIHPMKETILVLCT